jgi:hypothetical protein
MRFDSNPPVLWDSEDFIWDAEDVPGLVERIMAKIALNLDQKDLDGKLSFTDGLIEGLTDNADVPNPSPSVATLTAKVASIRTKRTDRQRKLDEADAIAILIVEEEKSLEVLLNRLAGFCDSAVDGNAAKLTDIGFELKGPNTPITSLTAPLNFTVTMGDRPGRLDGQCDPVRGAKNYVTEAATDPNGPWIQVYSGSRSRFSISDLTSGQVYYLRMRVSGSLKAGISPWSDIAQKRVP